MGSEEEEKIMAENGKKMIENAKKTARGYSMTMFGDQHQHQPHHHHQSTQATLATQITIPLSPSSLSLTPFDDPSLSSSSSSSSLNIENQKMELLKRILREGEWGTASLLLHKLQPFLPLQYPPVSTAICERISDMIEEIYNKLFTKLFERKREVSAGRGRGVGGRRGEEGGIKQVNGYEEFEKELYPVVHTLGAYLHRDILLFFKILRLLKEKVKSCPSMLKADGGKEMEEMEKILVDVIFPSLSCSFSNPSLSQSVWEIIKLFPYTTRYRLYSSWQSFSSLSDHPFPPFYLFKAKTEHETRRVMKSTSLFILYSIYHF